MNIDHYEKLFASLPTTANETWKSDLHTTLKILFDSPGHGDYAKWKNAVEQIPDIPTTHCKFDTSEPEIGEKHTLNSQQTQALENALQILLPWRKGPFNLFGVSIDAEWRSEQKWNRLQAYLPDLNNKRLLDVGCGNGYYMLRMLGAGAQQVIGVDPNLLFLAQFTAFTKNLQIPIDAFLLPIAFEQLPTELNNFDCVFSMGVLYHRRKPQDHLQQLYQRLVSGGSVYLETLIIDESYDTDLIPKDRYAGMRNVWHVPCSNSVQTWLRQCGFIDCQLLNENTTTPAEQRTTRWMPFHSLTNFLNPQDHSKTIEDYPAPARAIFSARKP